MQELEVNRNSHLIDPHLHVWGWEVPVYLFLGGITAGIMIFSAVMLLRQRGEDTRSRWLRWIPFAGPVLLSLGMLTLLLDLEYKLHVWRFYGAFMIASPMSWGSWILLLIYPATIGIGLAGLKENEIETLGRWKLLRSLGVVGIVRWFSRQAAKRLTMITWANLLLGVALGVYTGILLGTLGARPAWNSAILGPLFLVSGLSTGAALIMLFPLKQEEHHLIQRWDIAAIVTEMALLFLFLATLVTGGGTPGREAAGMFLGGAFTAPFWSLVVIAGLAVPLLVELIEIMRHRKPTWVAPALILTGGLALRWIIVLAGQA